MSTASALQQIVGYVVGERAMRDWLLPGEDLVVDTYLDDESDGHRIKATFLPRMTEERHESVKRGGVWVNEYRVIEPPPGRREVTAAIEIISGKDLRRAVQRRAPAIVVAAVEAAIHADRRLAGQLEEMRVDRAAVAGLADANSTEFDPATPHPVIALINEWKDADGSIQTRDANSDLGGTMRLGAQSSDVAPGTLAQQIYGDVVTERHRHRYEANVNYLDQLRQAGLVISALTQREKLTEIVELPQSVHPWFVGVQFHPESILTEHGHAMLKNFLVRP